MDNNPGQAAPQCGNYLDASGCVHNMVDLLGGGTPVNDQVYDVRQYAPKCGLVIGSDGRVYDLTVLLREAGRGRAGDAQATQATAQARLTALLRDSESAMALDRLGLTVPEGATFKAWEPFLTALGKAVTGEVAAYRAALRALPEHPRWPELLPEDWPPKPDVIP